MSMTLMRRPRRRRAPTVLFLLTLAGLWSPLHAADGQTPSRQPDVVSTMADDSHYRVQGGMLEARIEGARLDDVIETLSELTGVEFRLANSALGAQSISAMVGLKPIEIALREILQAFSYVSEVQQATGVRRITIHNSHNGSAPIAPRRKAVAATSTTHRDINAVLPLPPIETVDRETEADEYAHEWQLEEAHDFERHAEADRAAARTERGLAALATGDPAIRLAGIDDLVGSNDALAGQAIADVAIDSVVAVEDRVAAVAALAHHAADVHYEDEATMSALKILANDPDMAVAELAQRALIESDVVAQD